MDEAIGRQLVRQLKLINFWITLFGLFFVAAIIVFSVMAYKVYTYARHAEQQLTSLQSKANNALDFQQKVCGSSELQSILNRAGSYCQ